jgi:hypothetical protein
VERGEVQGGNEDMVDTATSQTVNQAPVPQTSPNIGILEPDIDPFKLDPLSDTRTVAEVQDPPPPYSPPYNPSQQGHAVSPVNKDIARVQESDPRPQRLKRHGRPTHRGQVSSTTQVTRVAKPCY